MAAADIESKIPPEQEKQDSPPSSETSADNDGPKPSEIDPAPDGGAEAWLTVLGAAAIFFCTLGFTNSFGAFQQYYTTHQLQNETPSTVSWIGSLGAFLQFAVGAIAGPLFDRFGTWVIRPAVLVYLFGIMMLSLCTEYWQIMLTQGILMGTTMSFIQFPSMAAASQHFDKKRGAALGIVISGSSIGGVVFPIMVSKMLNSSNLGFGWTVRICGFVMTPLMLFAVVTMKARVPPRQTAFFIPSAFKDAKYSVLVFGSACMFVGIFTPLFFIPTYAVSVGMDAALASYLLSIINAASTFGRIIPGILADKFGRFNMLAAGGISTGIVILCMTQATTTAGLVVYALAIGFTSGTIISGVSAALTLCPKHPQDIGTYIGMGMGVASISALISPPINGALINTYGGFLQVAILSGVFSVVGGFVVLASKMATPQGIWGRT